MSEGREDGRREALRTHGRSQRPEEGHLPLQLGDHGQGGEGLGGALGEAQDGQVRVAGVGEHLSHEGGHVEAGHLVHRELPVRLLLGVQQPVLVGVPVACSERASV